MTVAVMIRDIYILAGGREGEILEGRRERGRERERETGKREIETGGCEN